jgi:hypothetical protein
VPREAVLEEGLAVIGGDDEQRVFPETVPLQFLANAAQGGVDEFDPARVIAPDRRDVLLEVGCLAEVGREQERRRSQALAALVAELIVEGQVVEPGRASSGEGRPRSGCSVR